MSTEALAKGYDPKPVEEKWSRFWLEGNYAHADVESDKEPYTIVIPPPNVTGALHMGHALTKTIQDVLIRWKRMSGYNALWLPGTDHAGIATQMVVERELAKEGISRHEIGRAAFVERVWEWKERYHARITHQIERLGASVDWERERFTLDEGLSRAVREVFVSLYEEGLIYRGERMVNWSPGCLTVLSDLEVIYEELDGHLWHIAYPVVGSDVRLEVATTRPETMLGDTAVAVHPDDERYRHLVGKMVLLPLAEREIPIVADEMVDREFGTGAVKVTPGHDPNDFEVGQRHGLPIITIFDQEARLNDNVPERYRGLDNRKVREMVVEDLEAQGFLVKIEPHRHSVGHCQRSGRVVEPMVSKQWYVSMDQMAAAALGAVRDGRTQIIPSHWEKTYFHWLENIRDWCISRQLWWGHQIPVWYCQTCGNETCAREDPTTCRHCGSSAIEQDPDVLDTWFSSGLWPFSTLGWPDQTADLRTFYPTSVMETGFDIIFFWVARMMMLGLKFMDEVPFRTVFLHAMVRDIEGKKMSKTKGNVIDPLEVIDEHGADALRFTLAMLTAQGRDIKLSIERVAGYRTFVNKIWNASRFVFMNLEGFALPEEPLDALPLSAADRWILTKLDETVEQTVAALDAFRFNDAASGLYTFFWHSFCDWYIELSKLSLRSDDPNEAKTVRTVLVTVLDRALRLLHPFMPFVTEEIWQKLPKRDAPSSIMIADYPASNAAWRFAGAGDLDVVIDVVTLLRTIRGENRIPHHLEMAVTLVSPNADLRRIAEREEGHIRQQAGLASLRVIAEGQRPKKSAIAVQGEMQLFVPLEGLVDIDAEIARLQKELAKNAKEAEQVQKKLANPNFVDKAPADVVEKQRDRLELLRLEHTKLNHALELLSD
ncbi:MAG: valine--tRNA ligase [Myxococcales bacterium]|nr:valine--tRNA ligase [Myxococcales bacterium]